jgi:hypothetical protein
MSKLMDGLGHLKHHVQYPAGRAAVIAACNDMSDWDRADKEWFTKALPEGNYKGPTDVVNALLSKV